MGIHLSREAANFRLRSGLDLLRRCLPRRLDECGLAHTFCSQKPENLADNEYSVFTPKCTMHAL
jgi:hypothetical protein